MPTAKKDPSPLRDPSRQTEAEKSFRVEMDEYFVRSPGTTYEKLEHFPKFASRQMLSRYLALYEIFKIALPVQGSVIQCGVNHGGSLMWWAHASSILEPVNLQRRIFGFDTFSGFPAVGARDLRPGAKNAQAKPGGYAGGGQADLERSVALYDRNRFVSHVPKVALVPGDATRTIPAFLEANPEIVVSLLHLDFDLYAPTKVAIEAFVPRMPKGGVIVFDELNNAAWPGETVAVQETLQLARLRIQRFAFEPHLSYCVLE